MRALLAPGDVLLAMTDPTSDFRHRDVGGASAASPLVNWLQDLYPEIAVQLDVPFLKGPLARGIARLTRPRTCVDDEFGIAPGQKNAAESFQLGPQLLMIVKFAVKRYDPTAVKMRHGLPAQTPGFSAH
jgi:hypothetical protein